MNLLYFIQEMGNDEGLCPFTPPGTVVPGPILRTHNRHFSYNVPVELGETITPTGTAAKFVITQMLKVNLFDSSDFACLQIPTSYDVGLTINLDKATYIDRAHRRNIAVQYWTINDAETMRELIELGCDCIMTDDPALLQSVLEEYRK